MKYHKSYIQILLGVGMLILPGCTDDILWDDPQNAVSADYVSYSADVAPTGSTLTRSADSLLEPLVLEDKNEEFPLYLHTYAHPLGDDSENTDKQTRGMQISNAQGLHDIHGSFGVIGRLTDSGDEYISLQSTKLISTSDYKVWTTASPLRWPGNDNISFNAIAPFEAIKDHSSLVFDTNSISFTYSARKGDGTDDAEQQQDVLMAVANINREATADYNYRVPFKFYHSLASVKFAVRDVLKGRVVSISINGVYGTGDCKFTASDFGEEGRFDWTGQRDLQTYSQIFNHEIENGNFNPLDESQDVLLTDEMPSKTFMMIPQAIPADAEIELEIERYNVVDGFPSTIKVKGKIGSNIKEWKAGYEYVYTISTSKDNWVNVFEVTGNHLSSTGAHDVDGDQIYVYSPSKSEWDTYRNEAYFNVKSYRYKANDHTFIEALPWKAEHQGSFSYNVDNNTELPYPTADPQKKYLSASQWITDTFQTPLRGEGSATKNARERHDIRMFAHYVSTDWKGDETMQGYAPYAGYSKENPYDLSTIGGTVARSTANCYIIDRGGWYMFPIVYGNALWKGATNEKAYKSQYKGENVTSLKLLQTLRNHNGTSITDPWINAPANSTAALVWQDAYDLVEQIEYLADKKMIRFHVDPNSLQQGNAVIALKDERGNIMWSWHIWATEHWIDPSSRKPHVFDTNNSRFNTFTANYKTGIRECGDVAVTYNQKGRTFMMAPYNIGWCDPKKVLYLKRKSNMEFTQFVPDKSKGTGKRVTLPIIQDGDVIDYKYANNTYYQWGRKDPMRGYYNHEHDTKRTFGPAATQPTFAYQEDLSSVGLSRSIQHPYEFYVSREGESGSVYEDWLRGNFYSNLWNNHQDISVTSRDDDDDHADMWSHVKTIYDPSPAGYMVPNAGVWHVVQKNWSSNYSDANAKYSFAYKDIPYWSKKQNSNGQWVNDKPYADKGLTIPLEPRDKWAGGNWTTKGFSSKVNGTRIDDYNYKVWGKGNANIDSEALFFSSTGNRWWTDGWKPNGIGAGGNFGRNVSYAWSNRTFSGNNSYGMALGLDTDRLIEGENAELRYYVGGQFIGRRAMGRPVRSIREP